MGLVDPVGLQRTGRTRILRLERLRISLYGLRSNSLTQIPEKPMSLFKKKLTRYIDPATQKRVPPGTPNAVVVREESAKWYGRYRDARGVRRERALSRDKSAARAMLRELQVEAERGAAGLTDETAAHARRPLSEHLAAFEEHLRSKNSTPVYVEATLSRVRGALMDGCGCRTLGDLDATVLERELARRRGGPKFGLSTSNHYLTACKAFAKWAAENGRIAASPFRHLRKVNAALDVRKERRTVSEAELGAMLNTTASRPMRCGLPGRDREVLYRTAASTGLRAAELASLTPASLDLENASPTVTVGADAAKHRKRAVLPLASRLAEVLRRFVAEREAGGAKGTEPLWGGRWKYGRAAEMLRGDLAAAGIPYTEERGRDFDFHALRHQFVTTLANSGVHPKDAQALARHSTIALTMDRYTHADAGRLASAVACLPRFPSSPGSSAGGRRSDDDSGNGGDDGRGGWGGGGVGGPPTAPPDRPGPASPAGPAVAPMFAPPCEAARGLARVSGEPGPRDSCPDGTLPAGLDGDGSSIMVDHNPPRQAPARPPAGTPAGVAEWQTRRIQNPFRGNPSAGSSPASGTRHASPRAAP